MKAIVQGGRLRLDEPSSFAEGYGFWSWSSTTKVTNLNATERCALHDAISMAWASAKSGRVRPAQVIIDKLRHR